MAKEIILSNGTKWKTQTEARNHFSGILDSYGDGDIIKDPKHHDDLVALLIRYDNAITDGPSKIGVGIDHFEKRNSEPPMTPCFWIIRTDKSETDFSFYKAVKGAQNTESLRFAHACRAAVSDDLLAEKIARFQNAKDGLVQSEISKKWMRFDEAHLDHASPTFDNLVTMFRSEQNWIEKIPDGVLEPRHDGQQTTKFIQPSVAESFRQFHNNRATIRLITQYENLSMASKQRKPKPPLVTS